MVQPESLALTRTAAERSFVLLKNARFPGESPVLPLSAADVKTIALIGPLSDDPRDMLGCWAGQARLEDVITLRSALTQKLGAERLRYAKGAEIIGGSAEQIAEAVRVAEQSDAVILALGESAPEMTGEAASRAHLGLPGQQQQLLEQVVRTGKPVVLVLSRQTEMRDRKSTRLNSSHLVISYAVFCLKKKNQSAEYRARAVRSC